VSFRAAVSLFAAVWTVGLLALVGVLFVFQRADTQHDAQVKVERLANQVALLPAIGFSPSVGQDVPVPVARARLAGANRTLDELLDGVATYQDARAERRLRVSVTRYQALIAQVIPLAAGGKADDLFGRARAPGGAVADLDAQLDRLSASHDRDAEQAKDLADIGAVVAILFLLLAFSLPMGGVLRSQRRAAALAEENARLHAASLRDSLTDSLTGLPNRRAVFDRFGEERLAEAGARQVAVLDLDGFKLYNDTFGHRAGDVLLRRLGMRLQDAVADEARAYRLGGDEFCVVGDKAGGNVMARAQAAMGERGEGVSVRCSIGVASVPGEAVTLGQALHLADTRLYADKYSHRLTTRAEAVAPQPAP